MRLPIRRARRAADCVRARRRAWHRGPEPCPDQYLAHGYDIRLGRAGELHLASYILSLPLFSDACQCKQCHERHAWHYQPKPCLFRHLAHHHDVRLCQPVWHHAFYMSFTHDTVSYLNLSCVAADSPWQVSSLPSLVPSFSRL